MIKTLLTMLVAFTMAIPFTESLEAKPASSLPSKNARKRSPATVNLVTEGTQTLALARQSVRFKAGAVIRAKYAKDLDETRALYSNSRNGISRGSGQRARLRSLATPVYSATGSGQSQSARESVRYTADAQVRAIHANNAENTVALYMSPKRDFRGGDKSKRGSGRRAYLKFLERVSAKAEPVTGNAQSAAVARESVRYVADAVIKAKYAKDADYTVARYTIPELDSSRGDKSKCGSGHRAYLRSLKRALSTAKPAARNRRSLAATDAEGWQLLNK